jgi:endonuclease/exonuclease/phosphatase family metal-dependent hydrolase
LNAWGVGLPQRVLRHLRDDRGVIALALQEAWNCAAPAHVNRVLGFESASREVEGVALVARYGMRGPVRYTRIDERHNRWVVGGDVCLDPACATTVPIYSTHWGAPPDELVRQATATVEALSSVGRHVLLGDLNVHDIDRWSPLVPCALGDRRGADALQILRGAGYRDAWRATHAGAGWTGMASRPGCGLPSGSPYKRIDYVLTRGLVPRSSTQFAIAQPGADAPSDHRGLTAELSLAP